MDVVGEASYQPVFEAICGGKCESGYDLAVVAALVPEPTNPYDKNAVMVQVNGASVGYLSRADAIAYGPVVAKAGRHSAVLAHARIVGGWKRGKRDEGHFGIWLDLAPPNACT